MYVCKSKVEIPTHFSRMQCNHYIPENVYRLLSAQCPISPKHAIIAARTPGSIQTDPNVYLLLGVVPQIFASNPVEKLNIEIYF